MPNYYIEKDGLIKGYSTNFEEFQNTVINSEYSQLEIQETERSIVNFEFADTPEYIAEQERLEQERIQELTISKTNLFKAIYLVKGLTPQDIRGRIELMPNEQQRVLALIDFDNAKDFYRKHPLFGDFALSLGFSKEDIDNIFIAGSEAI